MRATAGGIPDRLRSVFSGGLRGPHSIRWRLTLLYSALFAVAGAALLAFTYVLVATTEPSLAGSAYGQPSLGGVDEPAGPAPPKVAAYVAERLSLLRAEQLHQFLVESGVALGVMTVVSVALGWLMAGRVLAPLRTMTAAARRISADNLHERLAVPGPDDELKAMADTFDAVLGRVEGAFEAQKQFVANASHELRTPLTLQQAIVDVALADPDASLESLRAACLRVRAAGQEQERLIDALLTLARSQRGLQRRELVDLAAIVRARVPEGGPRVVAELAPAPVLGDPQLIERLVVNLADNAVRHNHPEGEESWIRLWTGMDGGRPVLRIANSGPVIPPDQVAWLFQPFRRLGAERVRKCDGLGLGLSIVEAVATAHGGTVEVWPRPEGGLSVKVGFPPAVSAWPPPAPVGPPGLVATATERRTG
ncbi:cell wall metabolism sensor histidine kinase WalK [Streptomyces sp. NBC_00038]|uniref:sensor histidine kinase n=1 Tax=Streptomyces sp. NBC_00038 TaxID=2903615 RepID=UPI002258D0DD|nr:ATP-binding protein [Streptomyces sp. NBC_00038]MCX5561141.1 ATP-binding protein [Streptomyces sp. NBC_00038]